MVWAKTPPLPFFLCLITLSLTTLLSHAQDSPQDFVDAHNTARAQVNAGLPPMTWDDQIAAFARQYASQRARDCNLIHSGSKYGENLAGSSGDLSGRDAVKLWVNERAYYDYNTNSCASGRVCGHYTQVVWRDSIKLGCAKVKCSTGGTFIGCNYSPPGNFVGRKPY